MKIAIVGTGHVGSTLAYALVLKQFCQHLVIAGRSYEKAQGDALDLQHTLAFCSHPMRIEASSNEQLKNADVIVITASVTTDVQGFTSRLQLGEQNVALFRALIPMLAANNPRAVLVIVSNPVDVMTYAAYKLSGFAAQRVMGVGTLVDSARFRALLSKQEHIHPDDLRAYIIGEHGSNQFPLLSSAQAGGELIGDTKSHRQLFTEVTQAGFDICHLKGYTNYAIATATCSVVEALVFDGHRTMPLITPFDNWLGIENNCFSIPVVVGRNGVVRHLYPELSDSESATLQTVAAAIKQTLVDLVSDLI